MVDDRCEVLIAGQVEDGASPQCMQSLIPSRLRPAVGVQVGNQIHLVSAMVVGHVGEDGLRDGHLHVGAVPVRRPVVQELQLPISQQLQAGLVDRSDIEFRVFHVIRTSFPRVDFVFGAGLELAVFDDGKADSAVGHGPVIDSNALFDGRGVVRIGMMRRLHALDGVHPARVHGIAALGVVRHAVAVASALAPDIALIHVVVVRQTERHAISHDLAESPTEHIPFAKIIERRHVDRLTLDSVTGVILVDLIAGEGEHVRINLVDVVGQQCVGEQVVLVTGEAGNDDGRLVQRIAAHGSTVVVILA